MSDIDILGYSCYNKGIGHFCTAKIFLEVRIWQKCITKMVE